MEGGGGKKSKTGVGGTAHLYHLSAPEAFSAKLPPAVMVEENRGQLKKAVGIW